MGDHVDKLERISRLSEEAWKEDKTSPRYKKSVVAAFTLANLQLSKKKAAVVRADCILEAARAVFLKGTALPERGRGVDDAVKNILHEVQADRLERADASNKARSDTPVVPPNLAGIAVFSPSAAIRGLLAEAFDHEKEEERVGKATEARACADAGGATGTAPRRSSRSFRGKPAAVFEP